jgi:pimeloyl-ACP methyl ester carboxylesterase
MSEAALLSANPEVLRQPLSDIRRIAGIGAITVAGALLADRISGELRWSNSAATIDFLNEPAGDTEDAWIFAPGLGVQNSRLIAEVLEPSLDAPAAFIGLPHKNPSFLTIGQEGARFTEQHGVRNLNVYAHSMGGILMAGMAPYLPEHVKIKKILLDCAPLCMDDIPAGDARLAKVIARAPYSGGVLSSAIVAAVRHKGIPGSSVMNELGGRVRNALDRIGPNGGASATWKWYLRILDQADPEKLQNGLAPHLASDLRVGFLLPDNPPNDKTVLVEQAMGKWGNILGVPVEPIPITDGGHGISVDSCDRYKHAVSDWVEAA